MSLLFSRPFIPAIPDSPFYGKYRISSQNSIIYSVRRMGATSGRQRSLDKGKIDVDEI
jgi:hypothetical protein